MVNRIEAWLPAVSFFLMRKATKNSDVFGSGKHDFFRNLVVASSSLRRTIFFSFFNIIQFLIFSHEIAETISRKIDQMRTHRYSENMWNIFWFSAKKRLHKKFIFHFSKIFV